MLLLYVDNLDLVDVSLKEMIIIVLYVLYG